MKTGVAKYTLFLLAGLLLGWFIFGRGEATHQHEHEHGEVAAHTEEEKTVWTCAMHPQIKQDKPGKCPICGMDLTPMKSSSGAGEVIDEKAIQLSPEAMALAHVETTVVSRKRPIKKIALYGTIKTDERLSQTQTAHIGGRIEKLYISFTGEKIRKGETIAKLYSPELLSAQQELLEAKKLVHIQPQVLEAAREKLRLWMLSKEQIKEIEESGKIEKLVDIKANTSGIVTEKLVNEGDYINPGSPLFKVSNLRQVWALFDAFEVDLPFLKVGDAIEFSIQAIPNKKFKGRIAFIDPILNRSSRTAKVRVESKNTELLLKPEMYASATIEAPLNGKHTDEIVIPKSAILWTGKRSIVYVKQTEVEANAFIMREITLGDALGSAYVVTDGLKEGEEVVTNGTFVIDASAQLAGKESMMNGEEGKTTGHNHGAGHNHGVEATHSHVQTAKDEITFTVMGACGMCKERIEQTAMAIKGVAMAHWNQEANTLHLNYDADVVAYKDVAKKIAEVGHDNEFYKAKDSVYNELPGCCKYRK